MIDTDRIRGLKILVVEDNGAIRQSLADQLKAMGARVRVAADGEEGLRMAHGVPSPDLILSDVSMPNMTGIEMCRKLKADAHLRRVPVVFLSTLDNPRDILAGMRVGAADYLSKLDFRTDRFLRTVDRVLQPTAISVTGNDPYRAKGTPPPGPPPVGEERRAPRDPEEREDRVSFILKAASDIHLGFLKRASLGMAVFNLNREIIFCNDAAAKLLGIDEPEKPFTMSAESRSTLLVKSIEAFEAGVFKKELVLAVPSGSGEPFDVRLEVLRSASREVVGVLLIIWGRPAS